MGPQWVDGGSLTVKRIISTIYGPTGIGKTSLGLTADLPALVDCDFEGSVRALHRVGKPVLQARQWKDIREQVTEELLQGRETLVIDPVGGMLDMLSVHLTETDSTLAVGPGALSQKGWGELKRTFLKFLEDVKRWDKDIVLIAHSQEKEGTDGKPVERIYISGGSKMEILRQTAFMVRLGVRQGKVRAEFAPSENASGKNPAMLEPRIISPFAPGGDRTMADLIEATKKGINDANRRQAAAQEQGLQAVEAIKKIPGTAAAFNAMKEELKDAPSEVKQQLVAIGQSRGLIWNSAKAAFEDKPESAPAAENGNGQSGQGTLLGVDLLRTSPTNLGSLLRYETDLRDQPQVSRARPGRGFHARMSAIRSSRSNMAAGKLLHAHLEWMALGLPADTGGYRVEWRCAPRLLQPHLVEVKRKRDVELRDGRIVRFVGRIDGISGNIGVEYKSTGWVRWDVYMDSPQWKSYLYLFPEIEAVRYDVFKVNLRSWQSRILIIEDHDTATFRTSPEVEGEIVSMLHRWADLTDRLRKQGRVTLDPDGRLIRVPKAKAPHIDREPPDTS